MGEYDTQYVTRVCVVFDIRATLPMVLTTIRRTVRGASAHELFVFFSSQSDFGAFAFRPRQRSPPPDGRAHKISTRENFQKISFYANTKHGSEKIF